MSVRVHLQAAGSELFVPDLHQHESAVLVTEQIDQRSCVLVCTRVYSCVRVYVCTLSYIHGLSRSS